MADIFISYSSKDHESASKLAIKLRAGGFSVWIDEADISAATQWSGEIVKAIEDCRIFIILLSPSALGSHNVLKELSLASEKRKYVIPVDLEIAELPHTFQYPLAGIQRVPYKDFPRIEEASHRFLGDTSTGPKPSVSANSLRISKSIRRICIAVVFAAVLVGSYFLFFAKKSGIASRKRTYYATRKVVILPFENLGSNIEDDHLADGITSEVIGTVSHLLGIEVIDRKTAMGYKGKKTEIKSVATELNVGYVVDGTIQRQGKDIKVTAQLTEAATGKILLSDHFDGKVENIFSLQERMAQAIAFELQYSLQKISDSSWYRAGTKSDEAFAALMKGREILNETSQFSRTEEKLNRALHQFEEASVLDPTYASSFSGRAGCLETRFINFSHADRDLIMADSLAHLAGSVDPYFRYEHYEFAKIANIRGDSSLEEKELKELLRLVPEDPSNYWRLANFYYEHRKFAIAAPYFKDLTTKSIIFLQAWSNLISCYISLGDTTMRNRIIDQFQTVLDRYLRKNESDVYYRIYYAYNFAMEGRKEESLRQIDVALTFKPSGENYYFAACVYSLLKNVKPAIEMLLKAVDLHGFKHEWMMHDPDLAYIRSQPGFSEVLSREK